MLFTWAVIAKENLTRNLVQEIFAPEKGLLSNFS